MGLYIRNVVPVSIYHKIVLSHIKSLLVRTGFKIWDASYLFSIGNLYVYLFCSLYEHIVLVIYIYINYQISFSMYQLFMSVPCDIEYLCWKVVF